MTDSNSVEVDVGRQRVGAHGGELRADRLERAAEVGELLPGQIEP